MKITMIGAGYVGLVSGACFADFGHDVICVDKDARKIEALLAGRMPIFEPGLEQLVADNVKRPGGCPSPPISQRACRRSRGRLHRGRHAVAPRRRPCRPVLRLCRRARDRRAHVTGFTVVVTKSTVPVGTGDEVERIIRETNPDADVAVVSNPEFLREGAAIDDFKRPDRIVIGIDDERAREVMTRGLPSALSQPGAAAVHRRAAPPS